MYLETVACDTTSPSFSNSPWIRGAPHSGLAALISRIRSRSSVLTRADPIGVDSSTPSSVEIPADAIGRPSPAAPRAANPATSSTLSIGRPEQSVHLCKPRPRLAGLPHGELLPKHEVLEGQLAV